MVLNVTTISQIILCDSYEEYKSVYEGDEYNEYTIYLVKINDTQAVAYYGARRLKDTFFIDSSPPTLPDSPSGGKVYLMIDDYEGHMYVREFYYKYSAGFREPKVAKFTKEYLKTYSNSGRGTAELEFSNNSHKKSTIILCSPDGTLDPETIEMIRNGLHEKIIEKFGDNDLIWNKW